MIILYNIILVLFFPLVTVYFLFFQKKYSLRSVMRDAADRFGRWPPLPARAPGEKIVWVHCASIGEVRAVEPLLRGLTGCRILLTTLTGTGRQYALDNHLADVVHFAPFDFSFVVGRVMKQIRPAALILVETELWPGMVRAARRVGAEVFLVNARLSLRSFPWYHTTRIFWRDVVRGVDHVLARSSEDAVRLIRIGCDPQQVVVTGNIKYDRPFPPPSMARRDIGFSDTDTVFTAGSVRDGEETIVVDVWQSLRRAHPALRLIVAPRHAHAVAGMVDLLNARGITFVLRSAQRTAGGAALQGDCLVVDTFGELSSLYALSDIAFVGGSLVRRGGQNPIEPAAYGVPVLFGNDMSNFESEAKVLEDFGGGVRINNTEEFIRHLGHFIQDPAARRAAGARARAAVESQKGALTKTMQAIRRVIP